MRVRVVRERALRFGSGEPVRAASAVAAFGDGWLVAQDDATHAAWLRPDGVVAVRVLPPVEGFEVFSAAAGTKPLKPDFEAACATELDGQPGVLLLGSGSTGARRRSSWVTAGGYTVADLAPLYEAARVALELPPGLLNLEGACLAGDRLRWFHRGAAHVPSASVDVDLQALLAAATGQADPAKVPVGDPRRYDLGAVDGVALAVTDVVALPDGRILASAAAEDTPNPVDDGPVVAAALAVLDGDAAELPILRKVEGLGLRSADDTGVDLVAVVDADDPDVPSALLDLRVDW